MRRNHHHWPGLWLGLALTTVGGGLLARELGLLSPELRLVDFWPLILLLVGLSSLLRARGFVGAVFALVLAALGGVLLAGNLGFLGFSASRLWPGLLVLLGVAFVIGGARSSRRPARPTPAPSGAGGGCGLATDGDYFEKRIVFSGLELKVESLAWRGGTLDVTGGGVELDLRYARLAPEGAVLDVRVVMGGVDLRVPDTWQVKCDVTPLLGGADDLTRSTQGSSHAPVLRVVGSVTLGGLSIHH